MSKEKQIEEMGFIIQENSPLSKISSEDVAEILYNAGYRKQIVGEWVNDNGKSLYKCSVCGRTCPYDAQADDISYWTCNYCPNCGAKMKGGE